MKWHCLCYSWPQARVKTPYWRAAYVTNPGSCAGPVCARRAVLLLLRDETISFCGLKEEAINHHDKGVLEWACILELKNSQVPGGSLLRLYQYCTNKYRHLGKMKSRGWNIYNCMYPEVLTWCYIYDIFENTVNALGTSLKRYLCEM